MLHSANATQTARMFPGLSGVKDPLLKALPLSLKQEKGHKKKEEGQSQEPNVRDPPQHVANKLGLQNINKSAKPMTGGAGVQEKTDPSGLVKASEQNYGKGFVCLFVLVQLLLVCIKKELTKLPTSPVCNLLQLQNPSFLN